MPRIEFKTGEQKQFLSKAKRVAMNSSKTLARILNVHVRTLNGWMREDYRMSEVALESIKNRLGLLCPADIRILPDFSHTSEAGKIGGIRRNDKYGNLGTSEGRSSGGKKSCFIQQERGKNKKSCSGFVIAKEIRIPAFDSNLAEAVGIILGDGCVGTFQVRVGVSALVDTEYAQYIKGLFEKLFNISVVQNKVLKNTIVLVMSSRELVKYFNRMGLVSGNKVINKVSVPAWIRQNKLFLKHCLRGLFDTDGSVYYHRHLCGGHFYKNIGWNFRNFNENLLQIFYDYLKESGFRVTLRQGGVWIYNQSDIHRYFREIGTGNPKHKTRYLNYFKESGEVSEHG